MIRRLLLLAVLLTAGCTAEPRSDDVVARLGNRVLTHDDIGRTLSAVGPGLLDTAEAESRIVEQWVTDELLYQEALRRGLRTDDAVRRQIEASERSVVVAALLESIYSSEAAQPSDAELQAYFRENREQLRLLEPYVRIRALIVSNPDSVAEAARTLAGLDSSSVAEWEAAVERWAQDPEGSLALARSYVPESRVFADMPRLRQELERLGVGRVRTVTLSDSMNYVVQLVDRVPAGTTPQLHWIRETLRQRLAIESRKQLYARLVERLRTEALARESLEIP